MSVATFAQKLDTLSKALQDGNLIDDRLQVIKKGFIWNLRCFGRKLFSCGRGDPFADVRTGNVARAAILQFNQAVASNDTSREELKAKLINEILNPLTKKTNQKYFDILDPEGSLEIKVRNVLLPRVSPAHKQAVLSAINDWAYALNRTMNNGNEQSVCFAPLSIVAVLGMALRGMSQENKEAFLRSFELALAETDVQKVIEELLNDLNQTVGNHCTIRFANAVAVTSQQGAGINPSFIRTIQQQYQGMVLPLEGVNEINRWVAQKTQGKIPKLLEPEDATDAVAILLNAMYFSAKWVEKFDRPHSAPFTFANGQISGVQMISRKGTYSTYDEEGFKMLEIPFQSPLGHRLSYLIFLPDRKEDLPYLENLMTADFIQNCRRNARKEEVMVTMPMIHVNARETDLLTHLINMGLPLQENLPLINEDAYISKMVHQATLTIDHQGAEGAAATAMMIEKCCMVSNVFNANHNFAYLIVDSNADEGTIPLFRGNVKDLSALVR